MMIEATAGKLKRGPNKGDGGRKRVPLRADFPDNQIVAIALWFICSGRKLNIPFLEMLIYLFHDGEYVETPTHGIGAISDDDHGPLITCLSLRNVRSPRAVGKNYAGGSTRQTPDGRTRMKWRVEAIQKKIQRYKKARKIKDQAWLGASFIALDTLAAGHGLAMLLFQDAGWQLTPSVIERFRQIVKGIRNLPRI